MEAAAPISMIAVRDGLPLENAPTILFIWLDLQTFLDTVERAVTHARTFKECFLDSTRYLRHYDSGLNFSTIFQFVLAHLFELI
jgi:hypothetical protein